MMKQHQIERIAFSGERRAESPELTPRTRPIHSKRMAYAAILALAAGLTLWAGPLAGQPAQKTVRKVLDNGLTVVVKPEKGSGLVAISAMVKTGAAQESIQTAGIGNFVAQLLLAGTRQSSAEEVAAVADEVGGNIGAQWHPDFTEIRVVTTSAMFNHAMTLLGECLNESNFEEKYVEDVRAELLKHISAGSDNSFLKAYNDLRELLYQDNGYRRPDVGFAPVVKSVTASDLRKFFSEYYVPNNMVIAVAGDVTAEQAIDRADMAFAGVAPGKLPVFRGVPDESLDHNSFRAIEADLSEAYLMVGWLAPAVTSRDYPAALVAANALGGGKGSVMFRQIRQKRGMGYDIGTTYPRLMHQSHIVAYVVTDPFKGGLTEPPTIVLDDVKSALLAQVRQIKEKPLSDKDLQRAKGYTIGTFALSHQHLMDRAFEIGWMEIAGLGYQAYKSFPDRIEKVTVADVQKAANKYFGYYAAVLLLPKGKG